MDDGPVRPAYAGLKQLETARSATLDLLVAGGVRRAIRTARRHIEWHIRAVGDLEPRLYSHRPRQSWSPPDEGTTGMLPGYSAGIFAAPFRPASSEGTDPAGRVEAKP